MVHGNKKKDDQIAVGSGKTSSTLGQSQSVHLLFSLFPSRLYTTPIICGTGLTPVPQDRLSWHNPDARGLLRLTQGSGIEKDTSLFDSLLCRKKASKKGLLKAS